MKAFCHLTHLLLNFPARLDLVGIRDANLTNNVVAWAGYLARDSRTSFRVT